MRDDQDIRAGLSSVVLRRKEKGLVSLQTSHFPKGDGPQGPALCLRTLPNDGETHWPRTDVGDVGGRQ